MGSYSSVDNSYLAVHISYFIPRKLDKMIGFYLLILSTIVSLKIHSIELFMLEVLP